MKKRLFFNKYILFIIVFSLILSFTGCNDPHVEVAPKSEEVSLLTFEELQGKIDIDRTMEYIEDLVGFGPRLAGLPGEVEAGKYLAEAYKDLELEVETEEFPVMVFQDKEVQLTIKQWGEATPITANSLTYSTSTPEDGLTDLPLVYAGLGRREDFNGIDVTGAIAVVHRGELFYRDKVHNSAIKGAEAVIIINTEDSPLMATLIDKSIVPAIGVSSSEGQKIMDALEEGELKADLLVNTLIEDSTSNNIIGMKESSKETDKVLIIGAHYDSVNCPGANDNASGVGGLLEIATVLKGVDLPFDIQYIAFGSEEVGLIGSRNNVTTNHLKSSSNVIGMINLDMIGMGEYLVVLRENSLSDDFLSNIAYKAALDLDIKVVAEFSGRSDHSPYENQGIPVVFLAYWPFDPLYYHTERDTLETVDPQLVKNTVEVVLKTITTLVNEEYNQ
ncbi:M28 family metallopeptidase [Alkaliphilus serpentinus]|uniref:M28 family metallopeptidase n=1 Tax=Alkaliphilus serpentinus TaxID=1482731 RepID=UPI00186575C4|nr:M28 family metallopeptidase [Alkaliphilus serpentinus]